MASNTANSEQLSRKNAKREVWNLSSVTYFVYRQRSMIGSAAYYEYKNGITHGWDLNAIPNLKLGSNSKASLFQAQHPAL